MRGDDGSFTVTVHGPDGAGIALPGIGEVHLGGIIVPVSYAVPGGLTLTATVPSLAPFAVLQDLCGATVVGSLALPPELLALALTDLKLTIDVERSEVSFAATGPGFQRVQAIVRKATSWGFAVGIELDDNYRFSSLSPRPRRPRRRAPARRADRHLHLRRHRVQLRRAAAGRRHRGAARPADRRPARPVRTGRRQIPRREPPGRQGPRRHQAERAVPRRADRRRRHHRGVVLKDAEFELVPDPENVSISVSGAVDVTIDASPLEFIGGSEWCPTASPSSRP